MSLRRTLVLTSINPPTDSVRTLAAGAMGADILVIGDEKSPPEYDLAGVRFYDLAAQRDCGLELARICPTRSYARKNVGYLIAARSGAELIQETDDDNAPRPEFFAEPVRRQTVARVAAPGWVNVYRYFSEVNIWPRGLPLDRIHDPQVDYADLPQDTVDCPIQQGLADGDPDVDAVFRLVSPADVTFRNDRRLALGAGVWCPFNSQNTVWFAEAFALMYLPFHCSFRMTDIWRSFVAQRIAWANDWHVLFHPATVWQGRNPHNLHRDFVDEVPGYLNNARIATALDALPIAAGRGALADNLLLCYRTLIAMGLVGEGEIPLLKAWLADLGA